MTEAEHKLIEEYAKKNSMRVKEVRREAIRAKVEGNFNQTSHLYVPS